MTSTRAIALYSLAVWVGACDVKPESGGQTGDPGAGEFISAPVGGADLPWGPLLCMDEVATAASVESQVVWPTQPEATVVLCAAGVGTTSRLAVADRLFGLRIIEIEAGEPRQTGPALGFEDEAVALLPLERERVALVTERELLLVDVAGEAPKLVARHDLPRTPRTAELRVRGDKQGLFVVTDDRPGDELCVLRTRTLVRHYRVEEQGFSQEDELDLGPGVEVVRFEPEHLIVVRRPDPEAVTRELSLVALSGLLRGGKSVALAGRVPAPSSLEVLEGGRIEALVQRERGKAEYVRVDSSDPAAPALIDRCEFPFEGQDSSAFMMQPPPALFASGGLLVRDPGDYANGRFVRPRAEAEGEACPAEERLFPYGASLHHGPGSKVIAVGRDEDDLGVQVELMDLEQPDAPRIYDIFYGGSLEPADVIVQTGAVNQPHATSGASETSLVIVPTHADVESLPHLEQTSLFTLSETTITHRATLPGTYSSRVLGKWLLQTSTNRLSVAALNGEVAPEVTAGVDLWLRASNGWLLDEGIVQVRPGFGVLESLPAPTIEVVTHGQPHERALLARANLPPGGALLTRVLRGGDQLVVVRTPEGCDLEERPQTYVATFDLKADRLLELSGDYHTQEMLGCWLEVPETNTSWMARANDQALFVHRYVEESGKHELEWNLLDIRNGIAAHPLTVERHDGEWIEASVLADDVVYVSYARRQDDSQVLRYFVERIDIDDPAAPTRTQPTNVPGLVLAVGDGAAYTHDATQKDGEPARHFLRRVELDETGARITASAEYQDEYISSITLTDDGRLLVTSFPWVDGRGWSSFPARVPGDTTLRVVDPNTLAVKSSVTLWPGASISSVDGDLVVASTYAGVNQGGRPLWGAQVVNLSAVPKPAVVRSLPSARPLDLRSGKLLYARAALPLAAGALSEIDLTHLDAR